MNTTDNRNGTFPKDPGSPDSDRNTVMNEELYDLNTKETQNSRSEDAERGYTVRNGHNPNKPNPDERSGVYDDDLDDLDDDFHKDRDLEDNNDDIYEVVLEDEDDFDEEDEDEYIEEDLDEQELDKVENDEFDNPADTFENNFNETEEDLEDIDDDEEEEDSEYIEDDVQEDDDYTEEDKRRL
ncbi:MULTISPECIES: hypothetical protein [Flavobacterium]|uniref:Uncharacterized protein n=1 Tax=Flavobacterium panici TaxID=2654843 RepID=A0A9N8J201_9FLAO|nr:MULTISPECIES: hypothetical protein [Flavobacterium]UUF12785.1 hypothetical protein NLJ00_16125 [Flavobacterium panici]CAC9974800.1 hypothetical protein FLAPXU55_02497 [Flavobacterium panici]